MTENLTHHPINVKTVDIVDALVTDIIVNADVSTTTAADANTGTAGTAGAKTKARRKPKLPIDDVTVDATDAGPDVVATHAATIVGMQAAPKKKGRFNVALTVETEAGRVRGTAPAVSWSVVISACGISFADDAITPSRINTCVGRQVTVDYWPGGIYTLVPAVTTSTSSSASKADDDGPRVVPADGRPKVSVREALYRLVETCVRTLAKAGYLYVHNDVLVAVSQSGGITELSAEDIQVEISSRVTFLGQRDEYGVGVPPNLGNTIKNSSTRWGAIPVLTAVTRQPVVRADGTILLTPGYDATTGIFYSPSCEFPAIPDEPTRDHALAAMNALYDVIADFPFAQPDLHRAVWLAHVLVVAARRRIKGCVPGTIYDASVARSGKTILATAAGVIATGQLSSPTGYEHGNESKLRDAITSTLLSDDPFMLFDNIVGKFGGSTINRLMTSPRWKERKFHTQSNYNLDTTKVVVCVTSNNARVADDTTQRCTHVRIEPQTARPELRTGFQHDDLIAWATSNQVQLFVHVLTIIRAFECASCPKSPDVTPLGSFPEWRYVQDLLVWLGQPDPRLSQEGLRAYADEGLIQNEQIIRGLCLAFGIDTPFTSANVAGAVARFHDVVDAETFMSNKKLIEEHRQLYDAAMAAWPSQGGKAPSPKTVGQQLKKLRDVIVELEDEAGTTTPYKLVVDRNVKTCHEYRITWA